MIEKIYLKMSSIGIVNIVFGAIMIIGGISSIIGGNCLLSEKNKLIF